MGGHTSGMTFCIYARTAGEGGMKGVQHHPPVNCENNFILTLRGGCQIGDYKAVSGQKLLFGADYWPEGKVEDRGGSGSGDWDFKPLH